jgi:hypothetical protein
VNEAENALPSNPPTDGIHEDFTGAATSADTTLQQT